MNMIITKVELENIATHKSTTIDFQDGLNVLLGQNGTGKSTVLSMIGFNLFDFLQGNQKSYIREDVLNRTNHGSVKVWIVGLNHDQFIIKRTIGKLANVIEVSDAKTGTILFGINDKPSLQLWLKTQLGLKPEFNLPNLFNTSVGVPQGTFTTPFLKPPRERKDFFEPILQVKIYRAIWKKIMGIKTLFSEDIHRFENAAENVKGYLINKDELLDKAKSSEENLAKLQKSKIELDFQLKRVIENYDLLTNLKSDLDTQIQSIKDLETKRMEIISRNEEKKEEFKEAKESDKICLQTKKDYEEYETLSQELNKINSIIEVESKIENKVQDINTIKSSANDLDSYTTDYYKDLELQRKIEEQQELTSKLHNYRNKMDESREKYTSISQDIGDKEKSLNNLPNIESKLAELEKITENQGNLENDILVLKTELKQLEMNKEHSKMGKCPILNEECKNIEGKSLEKIFEKQIEMLKKNLNPKKKEFLDNEKKLVDYENIKKEHDTLKESKLIIDILKKQKLELGSEIKTIRNDLKDELLEKETLSILKESKISLEEKVKQYHILKDKFENSLPKLSKELKDLQNEKINIVKNLTLKIKAKDSTEKLSTTLDSITDRMNRIRENHTQFQKNEKLAQRLPELKTKVDEYENKLKKIEVTLKIELVNKNKIEDSFDAEEYNSITLKKDEINESHIKIQESIKNESKNYEDLSQQIDIMLVKEQELEQLNDKLESLEFLNKFTDTIRTWYDEAAPKITESLLKRVNLIASDIYRDLFDIENVQLKWENDYNVKIETNNSVREFRQLSGGEQMAVALAIRLAILKIFTNADFAFFDEPTTNLDKDKRSNLAKCIQNIKGFRQLFVISHDDTFEENAENIIKFTKDDDEITQVQFLSK
ncbi:MAG: SMC family ATPase [Candidatus Lokiarchaeota archaeon]|nr:SMC family ATPase [Candidatus Lokiarchaeota archaeon]